MAGAADERVADARLRLRLRRIVPVEDDAEVVPERRSFRKAVQFRFDRRHIPRCVVRRRKDHRRIRLPSQVDLNVRRGEIEKVAT